MGLDGAHKEPIHLQLIEITFQRANKYLLALLFRKHSKQITSSSRVCNSTMSSLAATQADGYYRSPDDHDEKTKHPKRKARSSSSTKNVVRFALPYDGLCQSCRHFCASGTRFNAIKTKSLSSSYLDTIPIFEFTMKCPHCAQKWLISTDPAQQDYLYKTGIQLREGLVNIPNESLTVEESGNNGQSNIAVEEDGNLAVLVQKRERSASLRGKHHTGALDQLEERKDEARLLQEDRLRLSQIQQANDKVYGSNDVAYSLRARYRKDRKRRRRIEEESQSKGWNASRRLLLPPTVRDSVQAQSVVFGNGRKTEDRQWKQLLRQSSIFSHKKK